MIPKIWSATDRTFSHFGPFFALLPLPRPPLNNPKDQNFEKMKKNPRDIIILHKCTITIIWQSYDIWFLRYQLQDIFFCYLGPFFALLPPPQQSKKWKYQKIKNNPGYMIILHKCTKNRDHRLYSFWDMACDGSNCYFSLWAIFSLLPL